MEIDGGKLSENEENLIKFEKNLSENCVKESEFDCIKKDTEMVVNSQDNNSCNDAKTNETNDQQTSELMTDGDASKLLEANQKDQIEDGIDETDQICVATIIVEEIEEIKTNEKDEDDADDNDEGNGSDKKKRKLTENCNDDDDAIENPLVKSESSKTIESDDINEDEIITSSPNKKPEDQVMTISVNDDDDDDNDVMDDEDDNVQSVEEEHYVNDRPSILENEESLNYSGGVQEASFDDDSDTEDDDIALVLGSSDEGDDDDVSRDISRQDVSEVRTTESENYDDDDDDEEEDDEEDGDEEESDDDDDDYDDDDLMNDVVMSTRKNETDSMKASRQHQLIKSAKRLNDKKLQNLRNKYFEIRLQKKRKRNWDFKMHMKKRSIKWLNNRRMHHVDDNNVGIDVDHYECGTTLISTSRSIPNKIENHHRGDDFLEKSNNNIVDDNQDNSTINKEKCNLDIKVIINEDIDMQQVDKIRDTIQTTTTTTTEDLKQQIKTSSTTSSTTSSSTTTTTDQHQQNDEQNKENVENNDKFHHENELLQQQLNGNSDYTKNEIATTTSSQVCEIETNSNSINSSTIPIKNQNNQEKSDLIMEILIENDEKISLNQNAFEEKDIINKNLDIVDDMNDNNVQNDDDSDGVNDRKMYIDENSIEQDNNNIVNICKQNQNKDIIINKTLKNHNNQLEIIKLNVPNEQSDKNECSVKKTDNVKDPQSNDLNNKITSCDKRARSRSFDDNQPEEEIHPTKKLRAELESHFSAHDRILAEYIEKTSNNSVDEIQKHLNQLIVEIQTLNDMIKAKEIEWNNMLHLKKVKEEICFRLTRKKQIMEIMSTKVGEIGGGVTTNCDDLKTINNNYDNNNITMSEDNANDLSIQSGIKSSLLIASTPNNNSSATGNINNSTILNNISVSGIPNNNCNTIANQIVGSSGGVLTISASGNGNGGVGSSTTAQSILQNRANMKSSDLAKEKANTQRLHRNILPKPSSSSTGSTGAGCSSIGGVSAAVAACMVPVSSFSISSTTSQLATGTASSTGMISTLPACFNQSTGQVGLTNNPAFAAAAASIINQQPILNSYLTAATVQQQLGEMLNGHHNSQLNQQNSTNCNQTVMVGRQGVFKDVKSIIAEYKQRHPEIVPRRGRRMKGNSLANLTSAEANSILGNVLKSEGKLGNSDLGVLLAKFDGNSRPSSNDSSHSMTNNIGGGNNTNNTNIGNVSFKDVLVQFAKISGQTDRLGTMNSGKNISATQVSGIQTVAPPPYPEVTLHPVSTTQSVADQATGSLLHGILTKYNRPYPSSTPTVSATATSTAQSSTTQPYNSSFSPTLARLLTAPERITSAHNNQIGGSGGNNNGGGSGGGGNTGHNSSSTGLNLSKVVGHNSEITITPVLSTQPIPQTLLQQQLQQQQQQLKDAIARDRVKSENYLNIDDEADDSVDRLVIDEGGDSSIGAEEQHRIAPHAIGQEFHENEVPVCQGCKKQEAQFVCAGCGNQWYCSRECQVAAWDEHSEVCTG